MATIVPTITDISDDGSVFKVVWDLLTTTNDNGTPIEMPKYGDKTVTITGTFGAGGTAVIEGSNDGTTYLTLNDPSSTALSKTAAAVEAIQENPQFIRPRVTAGDGTTSLKVVIVARLNNTLRQ